MELGLKSVTTVSALVLKIQAESSIIGLKLKLNWAVGLEETRLMVKPIAAVTFFDFNSGILSQKSVKRDRGG